MVFAGVILHLFAVLDPAHQRVRPSYNWAKLWLGFCITNAVLPLCALYTFVKPQVVWSGVQYWKRGGRIVKVQHLD